MVYGIWGIIDMELEDIKFYVLSVIFRVVRVGMWWIV